ncbi:hypothetical protein DM01DRAFT_1339419 [Hesseltinella vesiculosa]|uniref:STEEP1 domain-containing protein n=1 Tax=Hesseltinella vesiculosa TaxID=101127 RepID=A0A1X2G713_9FUNG|nr:hypothetical protein DM01DRAFT_1339419 [Hesseltinella vesiculosa]
MPKVVSSSTVSSSHYDDTNQRSSLHVYYCLCSEFILAIDSDLRTLPRRQVDNALVIDNTQRTYKLAALAMDPVVLKRGDLLEPQYRYHCPRCQLLIAYESQPERKNGHYTYVVDGSLTDTQGITPSTSLLEPFAPKASA